LDLLDLLVPEDQRDQRDLLDRRETAVLLALLDLLAPDLSTTPRRCFI